jgi:hypothetical protein
MIAGSHLKSLVQTAINDGCERGIYSPRETVDLSRLKRTVEVTARFVADWFELVPRR